MEIEDWNNFIHRNKQISSIVEQIFLGLHFDCNDRCISFFSFLKCSNLWLSSQTLKSIDRSTGGIDMFNGIYQRWFHKWSLLSQINRLLLNPAENRFLKKIFNRPFSFINEIFEFSSKEFYFCLDRKS